jgi:hypothetical protein
VITVVLVCGGRRYATEYYGTVKQRQFMWDTLDQIRAHYGEILILHGGAPGADSYAELWADMKGVHSARVRALWAKLGNGAGPKRNSAMLALRPHLCVAFPGGPGTADMVYQARLANVPTYVMDDA